MIIQIRGTSGSGKSTVMRRVMEELGGWSEVHIATRKQPLYYQRGVGDRKIIVLGHYATACGGCDTIGSARAVYDLIQGLRRDNPKAVILCEGLLLSEDSKWSKQLSDLRVIFLTTPLDRCLSQIKRRREAAGNLKPLNPANTENRVSVIDRARGKLEGTGIYCRRCSAGQSVRVLLKWLRLHAEQRSS